MTTNRNGGLGHAITNRNFSIESILPPIKEGVLLRE